MRSFLAGMVLLLLSAFCSVVFRRRGFVSLLYLGLICAGTVLIGIPALRVLLGAAPPDLHWHAGVPGGDWGLGIDPLSALFLLLILAGGVASAFFGTRYLATEREHGAVWLAQAGFSGVLAAMALVVTARSTLLFLSAWELMALGSYALIVVEHEHAAVRGAGLLYLVTTHVGTLALLAMFALWCRSGVDWTFQALGAAASSLSGSGTGVILTLALLGFGIKAGLVPFQFWLPPAHAAALSHISALLSGVVIKMGIYGLLRVVTLLGPPPLWWGWTVLGLGVISAILGVLWALVQHDIKRLLAYHSIENIGIILMGLGTGALGAASGHPVVALLGYGAAAFHSLNHALFKSVLFLAAGAVYRATGTRNLEELGGLARRMPLTWLGFLLGATAILGLPPFNGFVSEWLLFQGLLRAGQAARALRLAIFAVPALALVGGIALACFAKVAGVVFLGNPRSARSAQASEASGALLWPTLVLAGACFVIGALPFLFVRPILLVGAAVAGPAARSAFPQLTTVFADAQRLSLMALALVAIGGILWLVRWLALRPGRIRTGETWACGYPLITARMQYTASSFAAPLAGVFGGLAGVREQRGSTRFQSSPVDLLLDRVMLPSWRQVQRLALRLRPMQQGRLHLYLMYVVVTVVALLVYLVLAPAK